VTPESAIARLRAAEWLHRPETQQVFALLDGSKRRTRAVGGIVRDTLLDRWRERPEIDFATELTPEEVSRRAGKKGVPVYPTGIEHGTVTLKIGDLVAEVTTLREDVVTYGRHAKVRFGKDWRRDAERRDFTLNALYAEADGTLFDPLGGIDDCLSGVVRFIGDAGQRIAEDRLRVFRFFRFSASHGQERFDPTGLAAAARAHDELDELSAERVGQEMRRILALPKVAQTISVMTGAQILDFSAPLVLWLETYERHTYKATLMGRLALIVNALGSEMLQARWRLSNDDLKAAEHTLAAARICSDFHINEAAYRYPATLADAVDVAAALAGWTEAGRAAVVQRLQAIEVPKFPIGGNDLIQRGIRPGPALGAELERLEKEWIASDFRLGRMDLLAMVRAGS
jgi:poly(A) polymerase